MRKSYLRCSSCVRSPFIHFFISASSPNHKSRERKRTSARWINRFPLLLFSLSSPFSVSVLLLQVLPRFHFYLSCGGGSRGLIRNLLLSPFFLLSRSLPPPSLPPCRKCRLPDSLPPTGEGGIHQTQVYIEAASPVLKSRERSKLSAGRILSLG